MTDMRAYFNRLTTKPAKRYTVEELRTLRLEFIKTNAYAGAIQFLDWLEARA
jgi:hypothetical protein